MTLILNRTVVITYILFKVYVWDLAEGGVVAKLDSGAGRGIVHFLATHPNKMDTNSESRNYYYILFKVYVWDLVEGGVVAKLDSGAGRGIVHSLATHPTTPQMLAAARNYIVDKYKLTKHVLRKCTLSSCRL